MINDYSENWTNNLEFNNFDSFAQSTFFEDLKIKRRIDQ